MKKNLFFAALLCSATFISCSSDDTSERLNETTAKYIKTMTVVDTENGTNETVTVNYDANGRVSNVTDGTDSSTMVYNDNNQLTAVTGESEPFSMSELYQAPYDAYEIGDVTEYDTNGNPIKLRLFDRDDNGMIAEEYVSEITYDSQINPFLHTMEKAGFLQVLENISLNFSAVPTAQELIAAKQLLWVNNPKRFVVKKLSGEIVEEAVANYVYNADGYPTSATFTSTNGDGISVASATYTYQP